MNTRESLKHELGSNSKIFLSYPCLVGSMVTSWSLTQDIGVSNNISCRNLTLDSKNSVKTFRKILNFSLPKGHFFNLKEVYDNKKYNMLMIKPGQKQH